MANQRHSRAVRRVLSSTKRRVVPLESLLNSAVCRIFSLISKHSSGTHCAGLHDAAWLASCSRAGLYGIRIAKWLVVMLWPFVTVNTYYKNVCYLSHDDKSVLWIWIEVGVRLWPEMRAGILKQFYAQRSFN